MEATESLSRSGTTGIRTKRSQSPATPGSSETDPPTEASPNLPPGQPWLSSLHGGSPGIGPGGGHPLGLLGSPAWAGFKDSSCSLHPLALGTGRGSTRGSHTQVQPHEPPEERREFRAPDVPSLPGEGAARRSSGTGGQWSLVGEGRLWRESWLRPSPVRGLRGSPFNPQIPCL